MPLHSYQRGWLFSYIFNLYDFLLLSVAMLALLLSLPLILKREKLTSDYLLAGFILMQGTLAAYTVLTYNEQLKALTYTSLYPMQDMIFIIAFGSQGLLLYWYSQVMCDKRIKWVSPASMLVVVCFIVSVVVRMYYPPLEQVITPQTHHHQTDYAHVNVNVDMATFLLFCSIIMGVIGLRSLKQYNQHLKERLSNIDAFHINWLWWCALGFVLIWTMVLTTRLLIIFGDKTFGISIATAANLPPLVLMSCMVIFSQNTRTLHSDEHTPFETDDNIEPKFDPEKAFQLEDLMQRVKIYQDPDLRLEGIADSLSMSSRSVSKLIKSAHNTSFYDYVNSYRIEDARTQLLAPQNKSKSIQRIFEDAGFNSKTTFNTLFKKTTGETPSAYRSNHAE